ncbi:alpha/beta hydrolase [Pseudemcibacter aquimaris]|uniref:alpha/beta hydrolase n=1 Tax=Pseudemcibacter aquimaris TaxID=2857064 RepID=UPI002011EE10|nr:alpha/beta hydrolase-fold protein [Pseudemcibacter aquimaris]MCC3859924.1 esterase family protein [Pseudemcibacter aquimaris]WDU57256.1 esterase family protein [Pseudemcibacter aquimaris]
MIRKTVITIYFSFLLIAAASANNEIKIDFSSSNLEEVRPIYVRLPDGYDKDSDEKYPTLYVLNSKDNFDWSSYIVELQASKNAIKDMVIVGLPHIGNYYDDHYPFAEEDSLISSPSAAKHSSYIREEVIPYIESNYNVNQGRVIIGHSLAGLFVSHLYTEYPDSFSTFVALSPSFQHAPQMAEHFQNFFNKNEKVSSQIYMALGKLEHEGIQEGYNQIRQVFADNASQDVQYYIGFIEHTDHLLAAFQGTYNALAWLYADYTIQSEIARSYSYEDYIAHYTALSNRLNYPIKPRERHMAGFAQFVSRRMGDVEAGITALRVVLHYYPESELAKNLLNELQGSEEH